MERYIYFSVLKYFNNCSYTNFKFHKLCLQLLSAITGTKGNAAIITTPDLKLYCKLFFKAILAKYGNSENEHVQQWNKVFHQDIKSPT